MLQFRPEVAICLCEESKLGFKDDEESFDSVVFLLSIWLGDDATKTKSEMERKHLRTRFRFN